MGGDTCFYISEVKRSWEESQNFCSSQNSTLLVLKDKDKLVLHPLYPGVNNNTRYRTIGNQTPYLLLRGICCEDWIKFVMLKSNHVPPRNDGEYYWIGLHKSEGNSWNWEDGSALFTQKADWIELYPKYNCGFLYRVRIRNYGYCIDKHFCICEKAAVKLSA
ncbi:C-type lectin domain family 1 member B-like [Emydura macquarii macquarii]|uniref:C-type lectin domain family 1 member B-like n=1 Tax=Emydura macquarii macquarii TaxID=1129001 RepID=UPI00352A5246